MILAHQRRDNSILQCVLEVPLRGDVRAPAQLKAIATSDADTSFAARCDSSTYIHTQALTHEAVDGVRSQECLALLGDRVQAFCQTHQERLQSCLDSWAARNETLIGRQEELCQAMQKCIFGVASLREQRTGMPPALELQKEVEASGGEDRSAVPNFVHEEPEVATCVVAPPVPTTERKLAPGYCDFDSIADRKENENQEGRKKSSLAQSVGHAARKSPKVSRDSVEEKKNRRFDSNVLVRDGNLFAQDHPEETGRVVPYSVVPCEQSKAAKNVRTTQLREKMDMARTASGSTLQNQPGVRPVRVLVTNPLFDTVCGLIILCNSILIGVETQWHAENAGSNQLLTNVGIVFVSWYVLELLLRIVGFGSQFFTSTDDLKWNMFDTILVAVSLLEFAVGLFDNQNWTIMGRFLRTLRLLRVVRTLRIVRVLRYVQEIRQMIFAIAASMQTLFWSLALLGIIIYMAAVCITQGATEHLRGLSDENRDSSHAADVREKFGSLGNTMLYLYMTVSNGISWSLVSKPLLEVHWFFLLLFLIYISICLFGVMNVMTSIFVESAMQSAAHHRDLLVQQKIREREIYLKHMRELFKYMDGDGSNTISAHEMELFLSDDDLKMYLESLDISSPDARMLFRLLDYDQSGEIDIDEFCEGCLQLKGEARSFDVHCMIYENQRMLEHTKDFMMYVEDRLEAMSGKLSLNLSPMPSMPSEQGRSRPGSFASFLAVPSLRAEPSRPQGNSLLKGR